MAVDMSWRANHVASRGRAVGGKLAVEGDRLVFRPHVFDRALRASEWSVALGEVTAVEVAPRDPKATSSAAGCGVSSRFTPTARSSGSSSMASRTWWPRCAG